MKTTVNFNQFCDAFRDMGQNNNFSYNGKRALYDWLEDLADDTGVETELDVMALCCEFAEYENLEEFHSDYDKKDYPDKGAISNNTTFIDIDGEAFIIQKF